MPKFEQSVVRFPEPLVMLTGHTSAPLFSLKPYKICCLFHILASFFLLTCPMWTKISSFAINVRISEKQNSLSILFHLLKYPSHAHNLGIYFVSPLPAGLTCPTSLPLRTERVLIMRPLCSPLVCFLLVMMMTIYIL